jgi:molecular chaperone GrpE
MAQKDMKDREEQASENQEAVDINTEETESPQDQESSEADRLRSELQETKDKYLRLVAEFDNFRRRSGKERLELIQTAGREVIVEMISVLDDMERAQKQLEKTDDVEQIKEGITLVFNKFRNVLQAKGLKPMETTGKDFDAELHEAIAKVPAPSEKAKGTIVDEVEKGYYLNDKIIRHAKVVVAD